MSEPTLSWDIGTAYDLFASLVVLHRPAEFGLRAAWAAGVRQRLSAHDRETFEELTDTCLGGPPLAWILSLPEPHDSVNILRALAKLPPIERLAILSHTEGEMAEILFDVAERGEWVEDDVKAIKEIYGGWGKKMPLKKIKKNLDIWARAEEYGERVFDAMQAYYDVFYAEEEARIRPALEIGLDHAQSLAETLPVSDLVAELSQGVRVEGFDDNVKQITLLPSFWSTPFIFFGDIGEDHMVIAFGARPADASLVPGEVVPDMLVTALKALSDPTRLRIMRYLATESLTPTQLAHRLRLRAPTVVHHLKALRAAGLIYVPFGKGHKGKNEGGYSARTEGLAAVCDSLKSFVLSGDKSEDLGVDAPEEIEQSGD